MTRLKTKFKVELSERKEKFTKNFQMLKNKKLQSNHKIKFISIKNDPIEINQVQRKIKDNLSDALYEVLSARISKKNSEFFQIKHNQKDFIKRIIFYSILNFSSFIGMTISSISLDVIGNGNIKSTGIVQWISCFVSNLLVIFFYHKFSRRVSLIVFHFGILLISTAYFFISIFLEYQNTKTINMILFFFINGLFWLNILMTSLFGGI